MIEAAGEYATDRLSFVVGDLLEWTAEPGSLDVIVTNATLQWIPEQLDLLPGFVRALRPGGWLAIQIPGNGDAPSHAILRELAANEPYAQYAADRSLRPDVPGPAEYIEALTAEGCVVDAWETTYNHILPGENAVLEWVKGTGARPVLQSLPDDLRAYVRDGVRGAAGGGVPAEVLRDRAAVPADLRGCAEGRLTDAARSCAGLLPTWR